jgi:putative drug exporter of the RND superfamily
MASPLSTEGLARISARRPWWVLAAWVVVVILAALAAPMLGDALTTSADFVNKPDSVRGQDLLEERLRGPRALTETVIVRSDTLTVDDPAFRAAVERVTAQLGSLDGIVASAVNVYQTGNQEFVSADRRTTIIPVTLAGTDEEAIDNAADFVAAVEAANADPSFQVLTIGTASLNEEFNTISEEDLQKGEGIGLPVALIVLIVVFGALVAAFLPIVLALISIGVSIGIVALVGLRFDLSFFIVNMITMIGLAVGIDYALFVVERYREERRRGRAKTEAIALAGGTASRAVFFSGLTVVLALAGMFLIPTSIYRSLSLGAIVVVAVAVLATLTLIPALLSLLGDRIDWPRRRRYDAATVVAQDAYDHETIHKGFWGRITRVVMGRPVVSVVLSVTFLVACALPYLRIESGFNGASSLPEGEAKTAYTILADQFAAGLIAPVEIVVDGNIADPRVQAGIERLTAALAASGEFGPATVQPNDAGDLALISAPLTIAPDSVEAKDAIRELRREVVPQAFAGAPAEVLVAGEPAFNVDFFDLARRYTPIVFSFVLGLTFILLLLAFRSIVVPVKALVMNLLSVGAAYGLLVLVFQEGVGASLFGFRQVETIEAWLPLFLFSILFGLSMDYHVFLLSRIREHFTLTGKNAESVAIGLQSTGRIITGAALIMVVVFGGFAAGRLVSLQQAGFGLAVAVLLDATIIRSVLVPASMALLGDWNWYLPKWLAWLPDLRIEGHVDLEPEPELETLAAD